MLNYVSIFSVDSLISFWLQLNYHRDVDADLCKVTSMSPISPIFLRNSSTVSLSIVPNDTNDQNLCNSSLIDSS